jgi:predicted lipoprotein
MDRRSASLVDWWPIDVEKIERNLAGEEEITPERVGEFLSATQRGLGTAEYLLFGPGSESLADGQGDQQRCAYLRSVAVVVREEVAGILSDWQGTEETDGYAGYFDGTGSLALFDSDAEAEVVRSLVFQVRSIANMRLGASLGMDVAEDASAIPTGDADNSREDLLSQLDSIASVYRGAEGGLGLSARVASVSEETDARMLEAIESTIAATRSLEGSIISHLTANPAQVRAVYDSMKQLQRVLNTEIVSLLGVSVGFSDTDGDS